MPSGRLQEAVPLMEKTVALDPLHVPLRSVFAMCLLSAEMYDRAMEEARKALEIDESCVMVLKNCGPRGYPGMAEVGNMPLPPKLLRKGVTDMVRISDARMSGTAYGTVVLHISPEAAAGGPLALVESGDMVALDVAQRVISLHVDEATMAARRAQWAPPALPARGWERLYVEHVQQAHLGADLDFLVGRSGAHVARDSH